MRGQDCRGDVKDCEIYRFADFLRYLMRNSYGETVMVNSFGETVMVKLKLYGEGDLMRA